MDAMINFAGDVTEKMTSLPAEWRQESFLTILKYKIKNSNLSNRDKTRLLVQFEKNAHAFQRNQIKENYDTLQKLYKPNQICIEQMPHPAILFCTKFTLRSPYISKDDNDFYFMDNPIMKEKVFQIPMTRPSSWKGILRHACFQQFLEERKIDLTNPESHEIEGHELHNTRLQLINLFGIEPDHLDLIWKGIYQALNAKEASFIEMLKDRMGGSESDGLKGSLNFYPTFYPNVDYTIINPLKRMNRTSKHGPIYIEVVPEKTEGLFQMLYFPYHLVTQFDQESGRMLDPSVEQVITADIEMILKGIYRMFEVTGISAKNKAGFGLCKINNIVIESNVFEARPKFNFSKDIQIEWR